MRVRSYTTETYSARRKAPIKVERSWGIQNDDGTDYMDPSGYYPSFATEEEALRFLAGLKVTL